MFRPRNMKLFVDNLTVIDCSYLHPVHGIEGESWICDLVLEGGLDSQSMIMDFGVVKKRIKQAIDTLVDHMLVVPTQSQHLTSLDKGSDSVTLTWKVSAEDDIVHQSPPDAVCFLEAEEVSIKTVSDYLEDALMEVVNPTVEKVHITLHEEKIDGPYYHYSHGLKKHDGNCQRIAHGHRSKLEIWQDDKPAPDLVRAWCDQWKHIYIGSREDVVSDENGIYHFAYCAPQGEFVLKLPQHYCDLIDSDSTVECIAQHIAQTLKSQHPASSFTVKAYEGVHKGAIVVV